MDISNEFYREVILDHYKAPRNQGKLVNADVVVSGANPLCGDELELSLSFKEGSLSQVRFHGKGCSISQASASMMTEAIDKKDLENIKEMITQFQEMMLGSRSSDSLRPELEEIKSLEGVKKYPVRIKCALLAWNTLIDALKKFKS